MILAHFEVDDIAIVLQKAIRQNDKSSDKVEYNRSQVALLTPEHRSDSPLRTRNKFNIVVFNLSLDALRILSTEKRSCSNSRNDNF